MPGKNNGDTGLTIEQLQMQLDSFEGQKIQFEQTKMLLDFDKKNYAKTLDRKIRENNRNMGIVESNIRVLNKQILKKRRSGQK